MEGENGFLVDPFDAEAFVEPVKRMHNDRALKERIIDAGQRYARENFGMAIHIDGVCKIYDQLLG